MQRNIGTDLPERPPHTLDGEGSGGACGDAEGFRERLRKLASMAGSVNALAKRSGVKQSSLRHYLDKGGEPTRPVMLALCRSMGVCLAWLAGGEPPMGVDEDILSDRFAYLPLFDVRASAGGGSAVECEPVEEVVAFKKSWLTRRFGKSNPQALHLLSVGGESMEPTLHSGDLILVDREELGIQDGSVYVLSLEGNLFVKRIRLKDALHVEVVSDNPKHAGFAIPLSQIGHEVQILGRVVWAGVGLS
ncbi:MAG: helix-turn-helix transcriptional regulator [Gemmatimonadaceae bacterium]|nr:helix-turn-helix transcriptional regulator [Gloeobacterales cyanobacterium ES-bin-141]